MMIKCKTIILLLGITCSFPLFANDVKIIKPHACKELSSRLGLKKQIINSLDPNFQLNNSDCKFVVTRSVFPKQNKNGAMQFETGLQVLIYQNYQLKFICFPGWVCKAWQ